MEKLNKVKIGSLVILLIIIGLSIMPNYGLSIPQDHRGKRHKNVISGKEMYNYVTDLTSFGWLLAGTPEIYLAEEYIKDKFLEFGLEDVRSEPYQFPPPVMYAEDWKLTINPSSDNREIVSYPIYYKSTEEGGIEAELVYVGYGTTAEFLAKKDDVVGNIVLVDSFRPAGPLYSNNWLQVAQVAVSFGAKGVIIAHVPLAEGWGGNGPVVTQGFRLNNPSPIPGLQVGMHDGAYLRDLLSKGEVTVNLFLDVEETVVNDNNVVGVLPGMSDDIILVGAHLDACSWIGTVGDAGGVAVLLGLAKFYASLPISEREKTMMFVIFSSHHVFDSPNAFSQAHPDLMSQIACFVNLDNPAAPRGYQQVDGRLIETNSIREKRALMVSNRNPLLISITEQALNDYDLKPYHTFISYMGVGGGAFVGGGVPTVSVMTYGVFAHQLYDTPETLAYFPDELKKTALAHKQVIDEIDVIPKQDLLDANGPSNPLPPDNTPPEALIPPLQLPKYPFESDKVTIATIFLWELILGMKSIELAYSTDKATWTSVPMTPSMPSHVPQPPLAVLYTAYERYTAEIPPFPDGTTVYYKIIAEDGSGNVGIDDNKGKLYQYTVGDYKSHGSFFDGSYVYWAPPGPDGVRGFTDDPHPVKVAKQFSNVKYKYFDKNKDGEFTWNSEDYLLLNFRLLYIVFNDFTPGSSQLGTFRTWDFSFDQDSLIEDVEILKSKARVLSKGSHIDVWLEWKNEGLGPSGENSGMVSYVDGTLKKGTVLSYELSLKITDNGNWRGGFYLYDWVDFPRPIHPGYLWIDIPCPP